MAQLLSSDDWINKRLKSHTHTKMDWNHLGGGMGWVEHSFPKAQLLLMLLLFWKKNFCWEKCTKDSPSEAGKGELFHAAKCMFSLCSSVVRVSCTFLLESLGFQHWLGVILFTKNINQNLPKLTWWGDCKFYQTYTDDITIGSITRKINKTSPLLWMNYYATL